MLAGLVNFETMKFWEAELPNRQWIWGVVPSMFLSKLLLCQQYQKRCTASVLGGPAARVEAKWLCWPSHLDIPGLQLLSQQFEEHVEVFAPVPRGDLFHLQSFFKGGRTPPAGYSYYLQSKLQWWWLFKKDGHSMQAYKIKGNVRRDGSYWVQNILLIMPSVSHEMISAVTAVPPNLQDWELPLFLEYKDIATDARGAQLHLYHCALVPESFQAEVDLALAAPRGLNGHPGQRRF